MTTTASGGTEESAAPSFAHVFREHAAFVLRTVRRFGVAPGEVEDVAQEVFIVVHAKLDQYDPERPIRPWLFGIAARIASGHRRKANPASARQRLMVTPAELGPDPERAAQTSEARALLERALDRLDLPKREVFVWYDLESLPMAQIAQLQGCPLQTAYSRLHSARRIVQEFVEKSAREEPRAVGKARP